MVAPEKTQTQDIVLTKPGQVDKTRAYTWEEVAAHNCEATG